MIKKHELANLMKCANILNHIKITLKKITIVQKDVFIKDNNDYCKCVDENLKLYAQKKGDTAYANENFYSECNNVRTYRQNERFSPLNIECIICTYPNVIDPNTLKCICQTRLGILGFNKSICCMRLRKWH